MAMPAEKVLLFLCCGSDLKAVMTPTRFCILTASSGASDCAHHAEGRPTGVESLFGFSAAPASHMQDC